MELHLAKLPQVKFELATDVGTWFLIQRLVEKEIEKLQMAINDAHAADEELCRQFYEPHIKRLEAVLEQFKDGNPLLLGTNR